MQQLSKGKSIFFHLYPGVIITLGFIIGGPILMSYGYPPQAGILLSIILVAVPLFLIHLNAAKKAERKTVITELNGFANKLPAGKLMLYAAGLVIFAYIIYGITQPLNVIITEKWLAWLPSWYTDQHFESYEKRELMITLVGNLVLNGVLAPYLEELYFRGYLLPRMQSWGKAAFVVNTILFSLYHFWQPYIYLTLLFALLPMTYLVWKTKDLRLSVLTHSLLNLVGAVLSFGSLSK